jgi:hypothetical protein
MFISGPISARVAQEVSPLAAGTRNAITGRVTDDAGKPVSGATVTLVVRDTRWGTRFYPADVRLRVSTDAAGHYRIEHLSLGEYYVVAIPRNQDKSADNRPIRSGYGLTYHPSARSVADAKLVTVNVREAQTADIVLQPSPLSIVSGTVIGSNGSPASSARVLIARGDGLFGLDGGAFTSRPDGTFALAGLVPGTYFFHFREGVWPPPRTVETPLISGAKVVVEGKDLTGVRLVPIPMVRGTGRVVVDPAVRTTLRASAITVIGVPADFEGNPGPQRPGILKDDLTFEFRTWPGPARVRVTIDDVGWTVKAIRYNGKDVMKIPILFKEGQEITGIEVEVARAGPR